MATKAQTPPPIDKPLARAYLRKFTGWSTSAPPGSSDPTSLRVMHNCSITPDSTLRIRPGLRRVFSAPAAGDIVGDFEHFYTTDGRKAILFAIRNGGYVRFRTAVFNNTTKLYDIDADTATRFPGFTDSATQLAATATFVKYVQIDNKILTLTDSGDAFRIFWVGASPRVKVVQAIGRPYFSVGDRLYIIQPTPTWIASSTKTLPTEAQAPTTSTLISSTASANQYNFAYFYSFNNEIGESASSYSAVVKVQRRWSAWNADAADEANSPDQLVLVVPDSAWNAAVSKGATAWNLYYLTWSDQDSVPPEGVLLASVPMVNEDGSYKTRAQGGFFAHTPLLQGLDGARPLPNRNNRDDFSAPAKAANGLVAADRLILVNDQSNGARITWTSGQQGDYLNFSSSRGGGYKTLTSGNLYRPIAVKLWQNPQSADTITVLCAGLDGQGTSYYMNANTTTSTQSQSELVMGFEETSATPGTTSPYGVEVLNNALYHPLENNLMKSTASNYNINHLLIADPIQNIWSRVSLSDKRKMVSSQLDSSLYYLVRSPLAWDRDSTANGNQVWVCDTALSNIWSCWDISGTSLRKLELDGLLYMSISSGANIFVLDPEYNHDDQWDTAAGAWVEKGIAWEAETTHREPTAHTMPGRSSSRSRSPSETSLASASTGSEVTTVTAVS